jgi:Na+-transporting NADH:ubiquinone oxidoreductase subunit NqrB
LNSLQKLGIRSRTQLKSRIWNRLLCFVKKTLFNSAFWGTRTNSLLAMTTMWALVGAVWQIAERTLVFRWFCSIRTSHLSWSSQLDMIGKAHSWATIPKCMAGLGYHHLVKHKVNGIMILNLCRLWGTERGRVLMPGPWECKGSYV